MTPSIGVPSKVKVSKFTLFNPPSLLNELDTQTFGNLPTNLP